jgi:hypothetical protein
LVGVVKSSCFVVGGVTWLVISFERREPAAVLHDLEKLMVAIGAEGPEAPVADSEIFRAGLSGGNSWKQSSRGIQ